MVAVLSRRIVPRHDPPAVLASAPVLFSGLARSVPRGIGLGIVLPVCLLALVAPVVAPYDWAQQDTRQLLSG
jgi:hypothetical protein